MVDLRKFKWDGQKFVSDLPKPELDERDSEDSRPKKPERDEEDCGWRPWD